MKLEGRRASRWLVATAAGVLAAGTLGFGAAADAAGQTSIEHFTITGTFDELHFVAHGAFTGGGIDVQRNSSDVLKFGPGRLVLTHPNSQSQFSERSNPETCYTKLTGTGSYTLGKGTGPYAGITGSGTYRFHAEFIAPRNPDGSCNRQVEPTKSTVSITAQGPVSLGG